MATRIAAAAAQIGVRDRRLRAGSVAAAGAITS
jgi:hypothetical protein